MRLYKTPEQIDLLESGSYVKVHLFLRKINFIQQKKDRSYQSRKLSYSMKLIFRVHKQILRILTLPSLAWTLLTVPIPMQCWIWSGFHESGVNVIITIFEILAYFVHNCRIILVNRLHEHMSKIRSQHMSQNVWCYIIMATSKLPTIKMQTTRNNVHTLT